MNTTTIAEQLRALVQEWEADESGTSGDLVRSAEAIFATIPGVRSVNGYAGSMGSAYFDLTPDADFACDVKVRVSNHQAGIRGRECVWSFEADHKPSMYELGIKEITAAIAGEIEAAE